MHAIAGKAVCFAEAMSDEFKTYQQQVIKNAQAMSDVIISRGYEIVSGGTQNHLMLISLIKQDITGKDADKWLGDAHITVNKNAVPNDPKSPFVTSGIRIGTPAVTTRGFKESEVRELAGWICDILDAKGDEAVIQEVKAKVSELCQRLPVYAPKNHGQALLDNLNALIDEQVGDNETVQLVRQKAGELGAKLSELAQKIAK